MFIHGAKIANLEIFQRNLAHPLQMRRMLQRTAVHADGCQTSSSGSDPVPLFLPERLESRWQSGATASISE